MVRGPVKAPQREDPIPRGIQAKTGRPCGGPQKEAAAAELNGL